MLAVHANRRTSPALSLSEGPSSPMPSPVRSSSSDIVTINVVASPPWAGNRDASTASSIEQNASPRLRSAGIRSASPAPWWRGEV